MYKANWRDCEEYLIHGEAREVCILGNSDLSLNVCKKAPKLPCASGMLFFNRAYLTPGKTLEIHIGGTEEIHYILGGGGVFTIGNESFDVSEGDTVYVPKGMKHGLRNPGTVDLQYIVLGTS